MAFSAGPADRSTCSKNSRPKVCSRLCRPSEAWLWGLLWVAGLFEWRTGPGGGRRWAKSSGVQQEQKKTTLRAGSWSPPPATLTLGTGPSQVQGQLSGSVCQDMYGKEWGVQGEPQVHSLWGWLAQRAVPWGGGSPDILPQALLDTEPTLSGQPTQRLSERCPLCPCCPLCLHMGAAGLLEVRGDPPTPIPLGPNVTGAWSSQGPYALLGMVSDELLCGPWPS